MNTNKALEERITAMWLSRPDGGRRQSDTESFTSEVWDAGLRLAKNQNTHYQHVMNLIRFLVKDSK